MNSNYSPTNDESVLQLALHRKYFLVHKKKKPPFKSYNKKQYTGTFGKIQINVLLEPRAISHNKATGTLLAHTI